MSISRYQFSYKNPLRNLMRTRNQNDFAKLDITVMPKAMKRVGTMTVFLPFVSARKPQRCDETIIPTKPIALRIPLSCVDRFKSHCATGRMKFMLTVSSTTQPRMQPVRTTRIKLNFPNPVRIKASSKVKWCSLGWFLSFNSIFFFKLLLTDASSLQLKRFQSR